MFCEHCGAPIMDGSQFCGNCGQPVATATPSDAPRKKTGLGIALALSALLMICAAGVGLFFLLRQPESPPAQSARPAPPSSGSSSVSAAEASPIGQERPQVKQAVFLPPQKVEVAVEDFKWYYDYESSSGIPPRARVIADVNRLYGTWKGLILYKYEFEHLPSTYSVDIAPSAEADALMSLYCRGLVGPEGWMDLPGKLDAREQCVIEGNLLKFNMEGINMALLFWEEGNRQYAVCHFQDGDSPGVLMLMREL